MSAESKSALLGTTWTLRVLLVLSLTLIGAAVGAAVGYNAPTIHRSTAQIYVGVASGGSVGELSQGNTYIRDQMKSYAVLATSPTTLGPIIDALRLDATASQLARQFAVTSEPNTTILSITAKDADAQKASTLADALAAELSRRIVSIAPKSDNGQELVAVTNISQAVRTTDGEQTVSSMVLTGGVIGLAAGVAGISLSQIRRGFRARMPRRAHEFSS